MADYTTDNLVAVVKRRATLPSSQFLLQPEDIVAIASEELQSNVVPMITKAREEYFVAALDYAVVDYTGADGRIAIDIPPNAIGQKLRDVCWVQSGNLMNIPRLDLEDISGNAPAISGFYLESNKVVLFPSGNTGTGTIRLKFLKRPLDLVETSAAGQITSIDTNLNQLTLTRVPAAWEIGTTVNGVQATQPFANTDAATITGLSDPTVTLSSVAGLSVGDWICLEGESTIPQIPVEAHIVLAQATVVKCLESMADAEGMARAEAKLQQNKDDMLALITPRVEGAVKKITTAGNGILDWSRGGYGSSRRGW